MIIRIPDNSPEAMAIRICIQRLRREDCRDADVTTNIKDYETIGRRLVLAVLESEKVKRESSAT